MSYWIKICLPALSPFLLFVAQAMEKREARPFPLNQPLIKQLKKQGRTLISDRVGAYILRAEGLAGNKKYDQAIELLEYHYSKSAGGVGEKAQFARHLGLLYKQKNNLGKSLFYLQKALGFKALAYPQHLSALYNTAQIHVEKESYDKALELLKLWFSINETPFPQSYILLSHCYYAKNQLRLALKYVEKTISLAEKPKESWLSFAAAIYIKQKRLKKAQPHLERLTALYPSQAIHWRQLANVYLHLNKANQAFVTLDIANKMGHLKSKSDYLNLFSFYVERGMPYQGAKLLQKKIQQNLIPKEQKSLERLAEAFWLAREEKSALAYLKEASQTARRPSFFIDYGGRLLAREQWAEAERAFQKALRSEPMRRVIKNIQNYKKELALANNKSALSLYAGLKAEPAKKRAFGESAGGGYGKSDVAQTKNSSFGESAREDHGQLNSKTGRPALKAPPTNGLERVYLGLGAAAYHQKKYTEALSWFKKSVEADDTFLSGYQWIDYAETAILEEKQKAGPEGPA